MTEALWTKANGCSLGLKDRRFDVSYRMIKVTFLAICGTALLAVSPIVAHEEAACCATTAAAKASCEKTFAKLDLSAAQKTKMQKLAAECDKSGCTKEGMAKMERGAKTILSKKQFAAWKSACDSKTSEKTQS